MTQGFSLLELSVVIIIIGLLTGSVIGGQKLLESAKARGVLSDIAHYTRAIAQFREKYEELPGDMSAATQVWGIAGGATGSDPACWIVNSLTLSNIQLTCNGNGDHFISSPDPGAVGGQTNIWYYNERFRAWQHMAAGGFIDGRFSGRQTGANSWGSSVNYNVPAGSQTASYFDFVSAPNGISAADPNIFTTMQRYNALAYGSIGNIHTPAFVFMLDSKADDGFPGTGKYRSYKSSGSWQPGCTTTDAPETSRYDLSRSDRICNGLYVIF